MCIISKRLYISGTIFFIGALIGGVLLGVPYKDSVDERNQYIEGVCQTSSANITNYICAEIVDSCNICGSGLGDCVVNAASFAVGTCCQQHNPYKCCGESTYVTEGSCRSYFSRRSTITNANSGNSRRRIQKCTYCSDQRSTTQGTVNVGTCKHISAVQHIRDVSNCELSTDCSHLSAVAGCVSGWIADHIRTVPYTCYYKLDDVCGSVRDTLKDINTVALGFALTFLSFAVIGGFWLLIEIILMILCKSRCA